MNKNILFSFLFAGSLLTLNACKEDPESAENVDLTISVDNIEARSASVIKKVIVHSNLDWNVDISYEVSTPEMSKWVFTTNKYYKASERELLIDIIKYEPEQYNIRKALITITSGKAQKTIHVTQVSDVVLKSSLNNVEASNKGTTFAIALKKNVAYTINISSPEWIKQETSRTFLSDSLFFTVNANNTEVERSGNITFFNAEHNVTDTVFIHQNEKDVFRLAVSPRIQNNIFCSNNSADTMCVYIEQNTEYTFKYPTWMSKTSKRPSTRAITSDSLYFAIKSNTSTVSRSDTLWFTPKDTLMKSYKFFIKVEQPGRNS